MRATTLPRPTAALDFFLTRTDDGLEGAQRAAAASARTSRTRSRGLAKQSSPPRPSACSRLLPRLDIARAYAATEALLIVGDAILQAYHARQAAAPARSTSPT